MKKKGKTRKGRWQKGERPPICPVQKKGKKRKGRGCKRKKMRIFFIPHLVKKREKKREGGGEESRKVAGGEKKEKKGAFKQGEDETKGRRRLAHSLPLPPSEIRNGEKNGGEEANEHVFIDPHGKEYKKGKRKKG